MVKLGQGKKIESGGFGPNMQDHEINLSKACAKGSVKLRLLGEVHPAYRYWVKTSEGKKRTVITPFFNSETEEWRQGDPLNNYVDAQREFFYTINCIDRSDGLIKILILKTTVYNYLVSLAQDLEYGDPTDPENGYDITISKESTGPLPQNVKYVLMPGRNNTPLTSEEKELELFDLATVYKAMDEDKYIEWIKKNTFALMEENTNSEVVAELGEEDIPF